MILANFDWEDYDRLVEAHKEALARAEKAERERDEARQWLIDWEWERVGEAHAIQGLTKRDLAEGQWPGQGDHLFPEKS